MGQDQPVTLPITAYALLGLLTFGDELTGYELKQRADLTLRFYWVSPAMSQVYTELSRLAEHGLVEPVDPSARTRQYRITSAGRTALREWMDATPAGFPALKHPVALRLLIGHVTGTDGAIALLEEYLETLAQQRADLTGVRTSLEGADEPGQPFRYPALVADWGLDWYDAEEQVTRRILKRLRDET
jgi:DNA-binding PadR family transcriptional regulator